MQRLVRAISTFLAALALGGCATADGGPQAEKLYRTGSNIAQRDHALGDHVQTKQVDTADPGMGLPQAGKLPRSFGGGG
jgi:hypothetical protein